MWTRFAFPTWWHYDVLRGLEYLRSAGVTPDGRLAEAIELVASKRDGDGRWLLETRYPGVMPVDLEESEGRPSGGSRSAPCACWTGIQHKPNADATGRELVTNRNGPFSDIVGLPR